MKQQFHPDFQLPIIPLTDIDCCDNGWQKIAHVERIINIRCGTEHRRGELGGELGFCKNYIKPCQD